MESHTYFKVSKKIKENPIFEKSGANKTISIFVNLDKHNITQKVQTIVEDFRNNRISWIGNTAKAIIVTSSKLHAYLSIHSPYVKLLVT